MSTICQGAPVTIEGGTTVEFYLSGRYSPTEYSAVFALNNGASAPTSVAATVVNSQFLVTLSATVTDALAALVPAVFSWGEIYTKIADATVKKQGATGRLTALPSMLATATPSNAQLMVTALTTALKKLAAKTSSTVNFNGQSYTVQDIEKLQRQLVYWQSQVVAERAQIDAARGNSQLRVRVYAPEFIPMGAGCGFGGHRRW